MRVGLVILEKEQDRKRAEKLGKRYRDRQLMRYEHGIAWHGSCKENFWLSRKILAGQSRAVGALHYLTQAHQRLRSETSPMPGRDHLGVLMAYTIIPPL